MQTRKGFRSPKVSRREDLQSARAPMQQQLEACLALFQQGRVQEAEAMARSLVTEFPQDATSWKLLGACMQQQQRMPEALEAQKRAVELAPGDAEAHNNYGNSLLHCGSLVEAEREYRDAVRLRPEFAEAANNLGICLQRQERLDESEACLLRAIEIRPTYAEAFNNLGNTLQRQERFADAEAAVRKALQLVPGYAAAYYNLANIFLSQRRFDEAEANYRECLARMPGHAEAHSNLGYVLQKQGRLKEAEAAFIRALQLQPGLLETLGMLGLCLSEQGQLREAEAVLGRLVELRPEYAEARNNLANIFYEQARVAEAIRGYREAVRLKHDFPLAHSNLLFCLGYDPIVGNEQLFAEHCAYGEAVEPPLRHLWLEHTNRRDFERRLRVGLVSSDLHFHPVTRFLEPMLEHLAMDTGIALYGYHNYPREDEVTRRLRGHFQGFHPCFDATDAELASRIAGDEIDLLLDLTGHTKNNRLPMFARRPAPVQASWLGYPGTTGLRAMDYYLADAETVPRETFGRFFTEQLALLPLNASFRPAADAPPVNELPALTSGVFTFGSFNRPIKLNAGVVAVWSRLLHAVPHARLLLGAMPRDGNHRELIERFGQHGIGRERLIFYPSGTVEGDMALHHQVDLCLDSFPYNGSTTTHNSLWMGVPTLTLRGDTVTGRMGAGILQHAGLQEFIACDTEEFVAKGVHWANDLAVLARIRGGLRDQMDRSLICDHARAAEGMSNALRTMWRRWCIGLAPESFEVAAH